MVCACTLDMNSYPRMSAQARFSSMPTGRSANLDSVICDSVVEEVREFGLNLRTAGGGAAVGCRGAERGGAGSSSHGVLPCLAWRGAWFALCWPLPWRVAWLVFCC